MHPLTEKIMSSVKRSFTPSSQKKRTNSNAKSNGDDTPVMPLPYRPDQNSRNPPSIDQIAMGLHISRTPHLRPLGSTPHISYPQKHHGRYSAHSASPSPSPSRPPSASSNHQAIPRRSSLKKSSAAESSSRTSHSLPSNLSAASASLSTITSNTVSTPRSSRSFSASFRLRVPWLSSGSSAPPPSTSDVSKDLPRKKAVRFTGHIPKHDQDELD